MYFSFLMEPILKKSELFVYLCKLRVKMIVNEGAVPKIGGLGSRRKWSLSK